jgi:hypothetical protein
MLVTWVDRKNNVAHSTEKNRQVSKTQIGYEVSFNMTVCYKTHLFLKKNLGGSY